MEFNAQDYLNQLENQPQTQTPAPPVNQAPPNHEPQQNMVQPQAPQHPQPTMTAPPQGQTYSPGPPQSTPPSYQTNGYQQQGNYQQQGGGGYGGRGRGGNFKSHIMFKVVKSQKTGKETLEGAITRKGWEFLQQNPPGTVKVNVSLFDQEYFNVKQTGQGYREKLVGIGYFQLNRKGWELKNQQQGQYPQQYQNQGY